jgi:hypothetical protein
VILITQDKQAPFDIRANRRLDYDPGNLPGLRSELEDAFKQVSGRYPFEQEKEPRF